MNGADRVEFTNVEVVDGGNLVLKCRVGDKIVHVPPLRMLRGTTIYRYHAGSRGTLGLRKQLNDADLVELTAAIAQENFRAPFNRPFKVEAVGFSHGGYCPLPEHLEPPPQSSS